MTVTMVVKFKVEWTPDKGYGEAKQLIEDILELDTKKQIDLIYLMDKKNVELEEKV